MTKPDIFTVQARIRRFSIKKKLAHLAELLEGEGRTFRRSEIEALAKKIRTDALNKYNEFKNKQGAA